MVYYRGNIIKLEGKTLLSNDSHIVLQWSLVLRLFVVRRFALTTLVESGQALPTCRNSSVLSLLSAFLGLFRCGRVSSLSILVLFFEDDCDFSTHDVHLKDRVPSFTKRCEKNKENCNFRY